MSKRNKNRKKPNNSNLTQSILTTLRKQNSKPTNYKQVASILDVNDTTTRNLIIKILKKEKITKINRKVIKWKGYKIKLEGIDRIVKPYNKSNKKNKKNEI